MLLLLRLLLRLLLIDHVAIAVTILGRPSGSVYVVVAHVHVHSVHVVGAETGAVHHGAPLHLNWSVRIPTSAHVLHSRILLLLLLLLWSGKSRPHRTHVTTLQSTFNFNLFFSVLYNEKENGDLPERGRTWQFARSYSSVAVVVVAAAAVDASFERCAGQR